MSVTLSWLAGDKQLEANFDAVVTETVTRTAQVTSHPVEKGADVADHVQIEPLRITLEAIATNTPIREPANFTSGARGDTSEGVLKFDRAMRRPLDLWEALNVAMKAKSLFRVTMSHGFVDNAVIVGLTLPREAGSGAQRPGGLFVDKLTFSIEFQQIRTVSSKTGDVRRPKDDAPKQQQKKGDKPKKEATEDQKRSLLKALGRGG